MSKKEKKLDPSQNILEGFLKDRKDYHFNFNTYTPNYRVSSGSLRFDKALDGGLPSGIHRFGGSSEGGKTSCALCFAKHFLDTVPKSKVLYVKAEGRLKENVQERSKLQFVFSANDWDYGTAFVYKTNVLDDVCDLVRNLILDNPEDAKFFVIIDSVDAMILKGDIDKTSEESAKVCGPQVMIKQLFKRTSLPVNEYGHYIIAITQVISAIKDKYAKEEQLNAGGSGGGNASIHFSDYIFQFLPRFKKHLITEGDKAATLDIDDYNVIGHWCQVELRKSENEITNVRIHYPIKHGKNGGVWTELELEHFLKMFYLVEQSGSWFAISEKLLKELQEKFPQHTFTHKIQGKTKFFEVISQDGVCEFLIEKVRGLLNKGELF